MLYSYKEVDKEVAEKALEVMKRHRWYLTQEVIPFSFFSNKSKDEKAHLAAHLLTFSPPVDYGLRKPEFPEIKEKTRLVDLLGPMSYGKS